MSRGSGGAVLFEFIRVGAYVKVIAVDERTGIEVSIVGDPTRSSDYLERVAMQLGTFADHGGHESFIFTAELRKRGRALLDV